MAKTLHRNSKKIEKFYGLFFVEDFRAIFVLIMRSKFTKIRVLAIIAGLFLAILPSKAQSVRFIDALRNYQQGNFGEAKALFLEELAENPSNDAAAYYLATIFSANEAEMEEAEEYLKMALRLAPDNFWYKYVLAQFYSSTRRPELAAPLLEELISDNPKKSEIYIDLAGLYLSENDVDKALATLDKIDAIKGKSETVALTKTDLLMKRPGGDAESAYSFLAGYYQECRTPRIASILGDYYASSYRDTLALRYYNEAIDLEPAYTPAYFGKAAVCQVLRRYGEFFDCMNHVVKDVNVNPEAKAEYVGHLLESPQFVRTFTSDMDTLMLNLRDTHPADSTVSLLLSGYYYNTGRPYFSAQILQDNMERYPESFDAAMQYMILLYYQQSWAALEEKSTVAIQRFPQAADFLQMRAIAETQQEKYQPAIEDYNRILKLNPKDTTVRKVTYSSLGDVYHMAGDPSNAYKCYEKALKVDPGYNPVLNNYAYYLSLEGRKLKKAKEMSHKTIVAEPDNPTYLDTYAWILHLMGDDIEAKAIFKHAMLYGGKEEATILEHYATVLEALGERDLAKIYFNQAKAKQQ